MEKIFPHPEETLCYFHVPIGYGSCHFGTIIALDAREEQEWTVKLPIMANAGPQPERYQYGNNINTKSQKDCTF